MWSVVFAMVFAFGPATIHIDSTGWVTSAANLPSVISTDEVFWTWSFPCAPQRFTDGVLRHSDTCTDGMAAEIRIVFRGIHGGIRRVRGRPHPSRTGHDSALIADRYDTVA